MLNTRHFPEWIGNLRKRSRGLSSLLIFTLVSFALLNWFSAFVPYDMDEFLAHLQLARLRFPNNELNLYRESPLQYDLAPTGIWGWLPPLPLLCYEYVGSFLGLLYAPLYLLFPEPWSARFLGICMLVVQGLIISKLFGFTWRMSFLMLVLCMPYTYQHLVDFGQLTFQTTSVFLVLLLLKKWEGAVVIHRTAWIYPSIVGLLLFVCFWTRPSYIAILVPLLLLIVFKVQGVWRRYREERGRVALHGMLCSFTFFIPTHLLFTAHTVSGRSYYESLRSVGLSDDRYNFWRILVNTLSLMAEHLTQLASTTKVIQQFPNGLSRIPSCAFWALIIYILVKGSVANKANPQKTREVDGYLLLSAMTAVFVGFFEVSWAMHHVILIFPFLILAFCAALRNLTCYGNSFVTKSALAGAAALNIYLYALIPIIPPHEGRIAHAPELNRYINEHYSEDALIVVVDWGFYYTKAVYSTEKQIVVWPDSPEEMRNAFELATKLNRRPIFIGLKTSQRAVQDALGVAVQIELLPFDSGEWVIMREVLK